MNADKFFNEHSIEEISKKTKISPISLRFIKNKEFDKIPRVKFIGFIKLIEREFKVDLSELINEYDEFNGVKKIPQKEEKKEENKSLKNTKKEKHYLLYILIFIILIISGIIIYQKTKPKTSETNITASASQNITTNTTSSNSYNKTKISNIFDNKENNSTIQNQTLINTNQTSNLKTEQKNVKKTTIPKSITIIPHKKVWYKAINLDTNKTYSYLTSRVHTFPGANYYIKFGHGNVTIEYGDINITPNTNKIVRILLRDGNYTYVKKGFRP
ncbi:helix-turn-helix domain-containing protein [Caminibacter sp.]